DLSAPDAGSGQVDASGRIHIADEFHGAPGNGAEYAECEDCAQDPDLHFDVNQGYGGTWADAGDSDFVRIAGFHLHFDGAEMSSIGQVHDRIAIPCEEGLGGNADGVGNAINDDVHAAVHAGTQAGIRVRDAGHGEEAAGGRIFVHAGFGQWRDLADLGGECQL